VSSEVDWPLAIQHAFVRARLTQIAYVPDAGHKRLIELCQSEPTLRAIALTSEEEGIALLAGAWLGGARGALLMQSSGVGNCVNALASITRACQFPLLMLVTMRGEWGEGNPWQVPMGRAVVPVLEALGVHCAHVEHADDVVPATNALLTMSFKAGCASALLLGQRLIGAKVFQ